MHSAYISTLICLVGMNNNYLYSPSENEFMNCFIQNGFVIGKSVLEPNKIKELGNLCEREYRKTKLNFSNENVENENWSLMLSHIVRDGVTLRSLLLKLASSKSLLDSLEKFFGPNISKINWEDIWINDQEDRSNVTNKPLHQEYWTGASVDDIAVWVPLTKVNISNGLEVIPGSHLFGVVPNRNRKLIDVDGIDYSGKETLYDFTMGDAVFFHSLLIHGTAGRGNDLRIATTLHYKGTFASTSAIKTSIGQVGVREGPFLQIRRMLGNDQYTPFRTYGGPISNAPAIPEIDYK